MKKRSKILDNGEQIIIGIIIKATLGFLLNVQTLLIDASLRSAFYLNREDTKTRSFAKERKHADLADDQPPANSQRLAR